MSTVLIVNPRSGGGRTGRRLEELRQVAERALGPVQIVQTTGVGGAIPLARDAARDGARLVVAVGGDGTLNEVANGLLLAERPDCELALLPAGTGSDLARSLQLPAGWPAAISAIASTPARRIDVMDATFRGADGGRVRRFGVNVIGMGVAGEVVRRVNAGSKALGGTLTFLGATLGALAAWTAPEVRVRWIDGAGAAGVWQGRLTNAFLCNAQFCGGGMRVGPGARMDDGLLDLVIVPHQRFPTLVAQAPRLYDGRITRTEGIEVVRVRSVEAEAVTGEAVAAEVDGEQPGGLAVEVRVVAAALALRAHLPVGAGTPRG